MDLALISWNTMRCTGTFGFNCSNKCQEIASPSRSSSVARYSAVASFSAAFSSFTTVRPRSVSSYDGLKPFSTSTARPLLGRSAIWPTEGRTSNSGPRYWEMVLAFAGDSTMTNDLGIPFSSLCDLTLPCQGRTLKPLRH